MGTWEALLAAIEAEGCSWDDFNARVTSVNDACCSGTEAACPDGVPVACDFFCAEKYIPLYDRCYDLLTQMMGGEIMMGPFDALVGTCLQSDKDVIRDVYSLMRTRTNCVYDASFVLGHRRTQGFGGIGGGGFGGLGGNGNLLGSSRCPMSDFADRTQAVDSACAVGPGLGLPPQCSVECALEFMPFWEDCEDLVSRS